MFNKEKIMAIDIKVIPTLRGDEAVRFVKRAEEVMNNNNRVDFSAKVAEARAIWERQAFDYGVLIGKMQTCKVGWQDIGDLSSVKNEFLFLFSTEQQEAENLGYDITKTLHTRLMYYDLKKLTSNEN